MAITYAPKVGEVLECEFGEHTTDYTNYDGHFPPEMRKRRLVVVLNGRLKKGCLVVPISSKMDQGSIGRGYHVLLSDTSIPVTSFYDVRDRWAKADTIRFVSNFRMFKVTDRNRRLDIYLDRDTVTEIQKAVIYAVNAKSLLS